KGLEVIHPYGAIGREVQFGSTSADYVAQAERIKTYTEQVAETEVVEQVKAKVEWAECIVFLGFAYHSQNLSMLMSPGSMKHKFIYGTAYGMSDSDVDVVKQQILTCFNPPMDEWSRSRMFKLENKLKGTDLFDNYARSLSGGD